MTARPSLGVLAIAFSRIGAAASGGLGATIALLRADLIERRGWCDDRDVSEALALTKPLPGSTVVQIVAFLGWRLGGVARMRDCRSVVRHACRDHHGDCGGGDLCVADERLARCRTAPLGVGLASGWRLDQHGCDTWLVA